jgi:hypothetical protein
MSRRDRKTRHSYKCPVKRSESRAAGGCTHRQWLQAEPENLHLADREVDKSLTRGFVGNSRERQK